MSIVLQNYQNVIEMTSNMIYVVALGGGFKCPRKIHLNTKCPLGLMIRTQALRMEMWATERDVLRKLDFHSIYFCSSRLFRVGGHYSRLPFDGSLEEPIKHNKEQFLRIPEIPSKKTPKRSR